ncbi:TPA: ead/Ea22-like family protein [Escherichia coli]|uniref:ead/Ea22-like family protein n=1 Tax=Escherichia coli TaxID=562 RepID=UPI000BE52BBF|nr:ead/Ea22-like family protein [Escherichia coli]EFB2702676.1 ead/Ea22-like family protein [Escherichia coli O157:H7]MCA7830996.1 ead/Ea22-like family protein [Escherichia coli]MCG9384818.1 ead/Ea22-like family protein [Escherichia coli]MDD8575598.1 ead/Ea22-like family protein [Escherichia coli]MDD8616360.1 ead/Ea22-like family protein [Escherichia coli]
MSNIDKRGLREAAEKATKGRWAVEFDDEIYSTDGVNHEQIAMVFSENEARDAAFIAAANPATVLALLDELESKDRRNAELEAKLANPVLLPKTNGYWTEQEKAYEDAITLAKRQIRLAGFSVEDM